MRKIWQIGVNRSGTRSLCRYAENNGIPYKHWIDENGSVGIRLDNELDQGKPPFSDFSGMVSDLEVHTPRSVRFSYLRFREIVEHYPDDLYILNYRPSQDWLRSIQRNERSTASLMCQFNVSSKADLFRHLERHYHSHIKSVRAHFAAIGKTDNLLELDISASRAVIERRLQEFLSKQWTITAPHFPMINDRGRELLNR